jgi:hypothetical protein
MKQRMRAWGRVGGGLLAVCLVPLVLGACESDDKGTPKSTTSKTSPPDPAVAASLPEAPSVSIQAAANDTDRSFPLDATPSPDGKDVYYVALSNDSDGNPVAGVFHTAAGGGNVTPLASGDPLSSPVGITTSVDGSTLFVADPGADGGGSILTVPSGGGSASVLSGTTGYRPQGVTVARVKGNATLYFTGVDPASGAPGLFRVDPGGGTPVAIATGAPFGEPGGVTVTAKGVAYVADALSSSGNAAVVRVSGGDALSSSGNAAVVGASGGDAKVLVDRIGVGFPAGITLTHDESKLVVSGLDPETRTDLVYFVELSTEKLSALTETVSAFHEAAGLHRAQDTDVFAWADTRANDTGTVFVIRP